MNVTNLISNNKNVTLSGFKKRRNVTKLLSDNRNVTESASIMKPVL